MTKLVTVKTFLHRYEAELAKGLLAEENVEGFIVSDDSGGVHPNMSFANGVHLRVSETDLEHANEILKILEDEGQV